MDAEAKTTAGPARGSDLRDTSIGYAINLMMDYGNGRQVTISGTLPLNCTLTDMNIELDKLRMATNRQSALVAIRDVEMTVEMGRKTSAALKHMVTEYEKSMDDEFVEIDKSPNAKHNAVKQQRENMAAQLANYKRVKMEEIMRSEADVEKGELMIARLKKEIGE